MNIYRKKNKFYQWLEIRLSSKKFPRKLSNVTSHHQIAGHDYNINVANQSSKNVEKLKYSVPDDSNKLNL